MNSLTEYKAFQNGVTFGIELMTEVFDSNDKVKN